MYTLHYILLWFLTFYQTIIFGFSPLSTNNKIGFAITRSGLNAKSMEVLNLRGEVQPLNNFILVKVKDPKEQTDGGIVLPEKLKVKRTQGTVVALGMGRYHPTSGMLCPQSVVVGDEVIYGKYDGTEISLNGVQHDIIRDENVLVKSNRSDDGKISLNNAQVVLDKVLIEVVDNDINKSSRIVIDAISTKRSSQSSTGIVRKVGPGCMAGNGEFIPMPLQKGDMVKFRNFGENNVKFGTKEYAVMDISCILAKF